jgi:Uma2 family endonuclease
MGRAGILTSDDRVELLEGLLVTQMNKTPAHTLATALLREELAALLPAGWYVRSQDPITLAASEPEPDLAVVRGTPRDYRDRHPGPGDVAVVVEIADAAPLVLMGRQIGLVAVRTFVS